MHVTEFNMGISRNRNISLLKKGCFGLFIRNLQDVTKVAT